jgi:hypothetical protein
MTQKQKTKREEFVIRIGPLLKKALEEQGQKIKEHTYNVCEPSYYDSGEVLAKKILGLS